jgi:hypothetical protein
MSSIEADAWFKAILPAQRDTLLELRKLILSVAPEAAEEIKWSRPCYSNGRGMFCYLYSTKSYATLGFQKGTTLNDSDGLLEGTGKDMRHIKFRSGRSVRDPGVFKLLRQAASL